MKQVTAKRLDWLVREERRTTNPSMTGSETVFHYSIPALDELGDGQLESVDAIGSGKLLLSGGEVLISKLNPRLPRVLIAEPHDVPTLASTEFIALRPGPDVDERFLRYWLGSERLRQDLNGATMSVTRSQQRVRPEVLTTMWVAFPEKAAQQAIADFLDTETARIDALILSEKRRAERARERLASESECLVLGIQRRQPTVNVEMGPVLPVPTTWESRRNKTFLREVMDLSISGDEELLTVSHITGVSPRADKDVPMFLAEDNVGYKRVQPGDLVVNTMWAWMGALGVTARHGIVSPAYGVYRFTAPAPDGRHRRRISSTRDRARRLDPPAGEARGSPRPARLVREPPRVLGHPPGRPLSVTPSAPDIDPSGERALRSNRWTSRTDQSPQQVSGRAALVGLPRGDGGRQAGQRARAGPPLTMLDTAQRTLRKPRPDRGPGLGLTGSHPNAAQQRSQTLQPRPLPVLNRSSTFAAVHRYPLRRVTGPTAHARKATLCQK